MSKSQAWSLRIRISSYFTLIYLFICKSEVKNLNAVVSWKLVRCAKLRSAQRRSTDLHWYEFGFPTALFFKVWKPQFQFANNVLLLGTWLPSRRAFQEYVFELFFDKSMGHFTHLSILLVLRMASFLFVRDFLLARKSSGCCRVCSAVSRVRLAAVPIIWDYRATEWWKRVTHGS